MKKLHILLVEPDYVLGAIYKEHLERASYGVKLVSDVQKAIDEIDKRKPDAIILEIQLSSHNGYEFLYELRSYGEWQDIPVMIHSMVPENVTNTSVKINTELGVVGYLYKPNTSLAKLIYELNNYFTVASK